MSIGQGKPGVQCIAPLLGLTLSSSSFGNLLHSKAELEAAVPVSGGA